jgi:hypothetical protein
MRIFLCSFVQRHRSALSPAMWRTPAASSWGKEACIQILRIFLTACITVGTLAAHPAHAGSVVVGVNAWYVPPGTSHEEFIKQLADNETV